MNRVEYQQMAKYEAEYWWHVGRNDIVREQLRIMTAGKDISKVKILNIGCGTGGTVGMLEAFGVVYNVDTEPLALELLKENGYGNATLVKGLDLPFKDDFFDVVIAMDVLEHIDAEHAALAEWHRVLKKGGEVLITVPAYSWLWSGHDIALHHYRRYNRPHLTTALQLAQFTPIKRSYMICFSLPLVAGFRIKQKVLGAAEPKEQTSYVDVPGPVNKLFAALLRIESRFLRRMNLICGTSVLARAAKR